MLSQYLSEQAFARAFLTIFPPECVPASPQKQQLPWQMGWELTLRPYISLAPAHLKIKWPKSTVSAKPICTLKCTAHLSVSSYNCEPLGVYQNKIPVGVRPGYSQLPWQHSDQKPYKKSLLSFHFFSFSFYLHIYFLPLLPFFNLPAVSQRVMTKNRRRHDSQEQGKTSSLEEHQGCGNGALEVTARAP